MTCANATQAKNEVMQLIAKMSGPRKAKRTHKHRAEVIAGSIFRRHEVCPHQWHEKHLIWYLNEAIKDLSNPRKYKHYLTIKKLVRALGKEGDWYRLSKGAWVRPTGEKGELKKNGRPMY